MISSRARFAVAVLVSRAIIAAPAVAQDVPGSIPTPLAMALIGMGGYAPNSARIAVGAPPHGFPAMLIPAGVEVLGGAWKGGELTTIFVDSSTQALARYQRGLEAAGFRHPEPPPIESGFQSSYYASDVYCRDSMQVRPSVIRGPDRRLLEVTYSRVRPDMSPCSRSASPPPPRPEPGLSIPSLLPPPRTSHGRSGSSSSGDQVSAAAVLRDSSRSAAAIAAHYGAQLATTGWSVSPPLSTGGVAMSALEARDRDGKSWHGSLLVTSSTNAHHIALEMYKTEDR